MKQLDIILNKIASGRKVQFWFFLLLLIFLTIAMMVIYRPLCPGDDFHFHYQRLESLMEGMKGNPYLIYLDYKAIGGYGYFTKAFYPDFVLIPFAAIGNVTSLKFAYLCLIFTFTLLCGLFTYGMVKRIYKNGYAAVIAALLYTFAFYRLMNIYNRGGLGETITFTFIPIVFLGLYHIIKGDYKKWYILAIGFSLMIFTHVISSVLMFVTVLIFLIIYSKSLIKEPKRIYYLILSGVATLLIVSYYLYPMLEQMLSNTFYYQSRHTVNASDTTADFNHILRGLFAGVVYSKYYISGTGVFLTCAIFLRIFVRQKSAALKSVDIGVIIGLVFIFATSSAFPWNVFPFSLLNFIQYSSRLYEFSSFSFAVAGGYYLSLIVKGNRKLFLAGLLVVLSIVITFIADSKYYHKLRCNRPVDIEADYNNKYHLAGLEYLPEKVPSLEYLYKRGDNISLEHAESRISHFSRQDRVTSFDIDINGKETAELPLIYYKGYKAKLDEEDTPVSESENGLVQILIDKPGRIEVYYAGTTTQYISFYLTIISILGLCVYIFLQRKRKADKKG